MKNVLIAIGFLSLCGVQSVYGKVTVKNSTADTIKFRTINVGPLSEMEIGPLGTKTDDSECKVLGIPCVKLKFEVLIKDRENDPWKVVSEAWVPFGKGHDDFNINVYQGLDSLIKINTEFRKRR